MSRQLSSGRPHKQRQSLGEMGGTASELESHVKRSNDTPETFSERPGVAKTARAEKTSEYTSQMEVYIIARWEV
jgi:hypothetical protein